MGKTSAMPPSSGRVLQTVSVGHALVTELRNRVLDGGFEAGKVLGETDVAERFGVSRPTARSAITALVHEGLLRREPNKPTQVARLTQADVDDVFRIRIPLEELVLRDLTARREVPLVAMAAAIEELRHVAADAPHSAFVLPDLRFHAVMVDAVESPRLSSIYASLRGEMHLCMVQTRTALGRERILKEHTDVLEAAASNDAKFAVDLMREHLKGAHRTLHDRLD